MHDKKYRDKIKTPEQLVEILGAPPRDDKVIMCHGTFDVVHPGHIRHLMYAKSKAATLVTSLTCDAHIEKANYRPYVPQEIRALNLAAFDMVDYVLIDKNATPLKNLEIIQPDYFAKGYEYVASGMPPKTVEEQRVLESYGGEFIFTPGDIVYSSSSLIELAPPNIAVDKLISLLEGEGLTVDDVLAAIDKLGGKTVHVIGDTIVDSYTQTSMIGGQTKTPTISVRYESQKNFVGGAGIVAKHLRAAGAEVKFTTILGDDQWNPFVTEDLESAGVEMNAITSGKRPTTNKNAIVCSGYRLLKVDTLDNRIISEDIQHAFEDAIQNSPCDAIVFSDFRHGIFNQTTIPSFVDSIPDNVFRVADSQVASRWGNICEFKGFDLITPNEREARFALGDQDSVVRPLALNLFHEAACRNLILKLGDRGLIGFRQRHGIDEAPNFFTIDSFAEHVVDAVGAGDALMAYATLGHLTCGNEVIAGILGTLAASVECELDGNVPVSPSDVRDKLEDLIRRAAVSS
jgi:rfaE bifunctional protein kinase chain/domain